MASEFHGTETTSGLPVPGVTVTVTQADKKVVTTTHEQSRFAFAERHASVRKNQAMCVYLETYPKRCPWASVLRRASRNRADTPVR